MNENKSISLILLQIPLFIPFPFLVFLVYCLGRFGVEQVFPIPMLWTNTGRWPVSNRDTSQEVNGGHASE